MVDMVLDNAVLNVLTDLNSLSCNMNVVLIACYDPSLRASSAGIESASSTEEATAAASNSSAKAAIFT